MKNGKVFFHKRLAVLFLAGILLLTAGCGGGGDPTLPSTTQSESTVTTKPKETGEKSDVVTSEPTETMVPVEPDPSLVTLRQEMEAASCGFAAAWFGNALSDEATQEPVDPYAQMQQFTPELCVKLPFLQDIPKENVVGTVGDLYCIVPAEQVVAVQIYKVAWDDEGNEHTTVLYESDTCEPILLRRDSSDWDSVTYVTITNADGSSFTWYPRCDAMGCLDNLLNDEDRPVIYDFSAYAEVLRAEYFETMAEGWLSPTKWDLIGTSWYCFEYTEDNREVSYVLTFNEDTLCVEWNDGFDVEDHVYPNAKWDIEYVDGITVLTVDFREFAGVLKYNLLLGTEFDLLYTTVDMSDGVVEPGMERFDRILKRWKTDSSDLSQLIGTWELAWTEFEGYRDYDRAGLAIITITGDPKGTMYISYEDEGRPSFCFTERKLDIKPGEIYYGCGNDEWNAAVDHVGPYGTTYRVTVLDDGTLMKQQFWYQDGYPAVSYSWFTRVQ